MARIGYGSIVMASKLTEDIHVFVEKPRVPQLRDTDKREGAHELFSLFTADIIKQKRVFSR